MQAVYPALPAPLAVFAGLAVTLAAVEITYRYVEVAGQRLARRLTKRYRLRPRRGRAWQGGAHRASTARPAFVGRTR